MEIKNIETCKGKSCNNCECKNHLKQVTFGEEFKIDTRRLTVTLCEECIKELYYDLQEFLFN